MDGEPAFVLHTRDYRETSQLVDVFSRHYGRLRVVARGSRRRKGGGRNLEPFVPLVASWCGKGELKTLTSAEPSGLPLMLRGDCLYSGFYLNELILRLLADHDPHQPLFDSYLEALRHLSAGEGIEPALRCFERQLLSELGYGLALGHTADTGETVSPEAWYWFDPLVGVSSSTPGVSATTPQQNRFRGRELLAVEAGDYGDAEKAKAAKRLLRLAIHNLLGGRSLRSRELFIRERLQNQEPQ